MASIELLRLWKLHEIDSRILEIRRRASALDPGKREAAHLAEVQAKFDEAAQKAKALHAEQSDLELKRKSAQDKAKRIEAELFGGKIVNPREVENMQKEIASLRKQVDSSDLALLELMEATPAARQAAAAIEPELEQTKKALADRKKTALSEKATLEKAFAEANAARPEAAKLVDAGLLARYDAIRAKHGTGMAKIKNGNVCEGCGNLLPERTLEMAKTDRVATCEQCHRILYYTEGLV